MRQNAGTKSSTCYYRLIESYRNLNDRVCHRTILNIGYLDYLSTYQLNKIQKLLTDRSCGKPSLFDETDEVVNEHVEQYWERMLKEKRIDNPESIKGRRTRLLDSDTIKHKDVKEMGSEWIGYQAIKQLQIEEYLRGNQWGEEQIQLTLTQIISRAVYPASELKTSRWIPENSGICELTGYPIEQITKDKLYQNALALYAVKNGLEQHLAKRSNELFDIQDKIVLYDLTNTYFEGEKRNSKLAKFGRSKEKRSDAKLIVLALVVNTEGFIKYSSVFEGNTTDCNTLPDIIDHLRISSSDGDHKNLVVIDAGIATEENLKIIQAKGYNYLCVSRSRLKEYEFVENTHQQVVYTQDGQALTLQRVKSLNHTDYFIKVKSPGKTMKEASMKLKFESRFAEEIERIKAGITKKNGIKKADKVNQRIGKVLQKYPSVAKNYVINIDTNKLDQVIEIRCIVNTPKNLIQTEGLGVYFLRTNLNMKDEQMVWKAYNTIREIEATFRTLKTDLDLRPIYHKTDKATLAHLHLALLAYWLVNTVRHQLKSKGIYSNWQEIVRIGNTQKSLTTIGTNLDNRTIGIRRCSEPNQNLKSIYEALGYKQMPFTKRKFVVHKPELKKNNSLIFRHDSSV